MKWTRITPADNIPAREGRSVELSEGSLAIFNLGERFVAIENRCPHNGGPLADGLVGGTAVHCPLHNWKICLESGEVSKPCSQHGEFRVKTFPVRVENGIVEVFA